MTTKFEELLRYLLTELFPPNIDPGPFFGSFYSKNSPRANFGMGLFSVSPGIVGYVFATVSSTTQSRIESTIFDEYQDLWVEEK